MTSQPRATIRLFVVSAALSLVPVILLGLVMGASYRSEARRRGLAEGRSEAQLIAQTAIEPLLGAAGLRVHAQVGRPGGRGYFLWRRAD